MNVIADTASSTDRRNFGLRAYLAGGTATSALIAGAAIVFLSLAAYVAFNGLGAGADTAPKHDAVIIGPGGAPAAAGTAAAAAGRAASAVGRGSAAQSAGAAGRGAGEAGGGASGSGARGSGAGGAASGTATGGTAGGGTVDGSGSTPGGTTTGGQTGTGAGGGGGSNGALGNAVNGVSNTASNLGVNPDTSGVQDIVEPIDETATNTLNNVGGALDNPNLGNTANQTINQTTNAVNETLNQTTSGVLGQGGPTGPLLGQ
jgi:hypothetical protein